MCSTKKKGNPWKKICDQMIIFNFDQTSKVIQFKDSYMKPTFKYGVFPLVYFCVLYKLPYEYDINLVHFLYFFEYVLNTNSKSTTYWEQNDLYNPSEFPLSFVVGLGI